MTTNFATRFPTYRRPVKPFAAARPRTKMVVAIARVLSVAGAPDRDHERKRDTPVQSRFRALPPGEHGGTVRSILLRVSGPDAIHARTPVFQSHGSPEARCDCSFWFDFQSYFSSFQRRNAVKTSARDLSWRPATPSATAMTPGSRVRRNGLVASSRSSREGTVGWPVERRC